MMLPKHFRWIVWMLKFDTMTKLDEMFFKLMLFFVWT